MKLTDKMIKGLPAPERGNRIVYDDSVRGFGLRVTAAGVKSFVLTYWSAGRQRRYTIGRYPDWPLATARAEAKRLKLELRANGSDPLARLEAERSAPTMADLCQRYLEEHASKKRPSSQGDARSHRSGRSSSPPSATRRSRRSPSPIATGCTARSPRRGTKHRANRVIALLSKAFNLSIRWGWRLDNPCRGIERNPEGKRTRYLSADELARLTAALADYDDQQAANIIRLLLLTGARRAGGARRQVGGPRPRAGRLDEAGPHDEAEDRAPRPVVGAGARAAGGDSRQGGRRCRLRISRAGQQRHRVDLKKPWPKICKAAGITGVRVHDLRHTYASLLGQRRLLAADDRRPARAHAAADDASLRPLVR